MAIAVCKDTITMLGEIPEEQLKEEKPVQNFSFKEFLDRASGFRRNGAAQEEPKENQSHDEK